MKKQNEKKKRTWKRLVIAGGVLLIGAAAACYAVGDFFVSYALKRNEIVLSEGSSDPEDQAEIDALLGSGYWKELNEEKDRWLEETEMEVVSITSKDNLTLKAEYAAKEDSHQWAILIHGYMSNRQSMETYAMTYEKNGYHVLLPDNRTHGESEGEYIGMGWLDKEDIKLWIQWLIEKDPEAQIVLHGVSMGGATVMMLSGDEDVSKQVVGYVEDCGYTSVWDIFAKELKLRFSLPTFPVLDISSLYAKLFVGYDLKEASAQKQVAMNERPMLFIHGAEDDFVPTDMVYEVYEAASCEKELYVVEGAGHAGALSTDPAKYWETVFGFLEEKCGLE